ncbi:hypothetical protein MPTK1_6g02850 [Marchantia polymorpha subsp. ruderalis]|uniref:Uncharacterized protein n=2 Tax=Marchantia polymorpha TaxID=3197 RepID=A0AAF6BMX1_MARPO|nr:hypothetical protein MARPO_0035s0072 [Marchantia polymorpha]BBN13355.1 hypothetical protein Mp_6g02850 [Marchantia polymorpha subsp. ruderalis]|eukprot:PTQ41283.1 hypothetical protein MARPO_0035s0072 [Marchantia polymorpha]
MPSIRTIDDRYGPSLFLQSKILTSPALNFHDDSSRAETCGFLHDCPGNNSSNRVVCKDISSTGPVDLAVSPLPSLTWSDQKDSFILIHKLKDKDLRS